MSKEKRNISVIRDADGNKIVMINDIIFKGKRRVDWKDVREYLKNLVGDVYEIAETEDIIYIGSDLPSEYTGSEYTAGLKGTRAKAKANATQGIQKLVEISTNRSFAKNKKAKHSLNAAKGWYRYETRFALPVYGIDNEVCRYNVFHAYIIVRHDNNGKKYLYDLINIKKEASTPFCYQET